MMGEIQLLKAALRNKGGAGLHILVRSLRKEMGCTDTKLSGDILSCFLSRLKVIRRHKFYEYSEKGPG